MEEYLIQRIKAVATMATLEETDDLYPWSWPTKTECFDRGVYDGRIIMAREILDELGIEYEIDVDLF